MRWLLPRRRLPAEPREAPTGGPETGQPGDNEALGRRTTDPTPAVQAEAFEATDPPASPRPVDPAQIEMRNRPKTLIRWLRAHQLGMCDHPAPRRPTERRDSPNPDTTSTPGASPGRICTPIRADSTCRDGSRGRMSRLCPPGGQAGPEDDPSVENARPPGRNDSRSRGVTRPLPDVRVGEHSFDPEAPERGSDARREIHVRHADPQDRPNRSNVPLQTHRTDASSRSKVGPVPANAQFRRHCGLRPGQLVAHVSAHAHGDNEALDRPQSPQVAEPAAPERGGAEHRSERPQTAVSEDHRRQRSRWTAREVTIDRATRQRSAGPPAR